MKGGFIGKIRNIEKLTSIGDKREYWKTRETVLGK